MLSLVEIKSDSIFMDAKIIKKEDYSKLLLIEEFKKIISKNADSLMKTSLKEFYEKKYLGYEQGIDDAKAAYIEEHAACTRKYNEELSAIEQAMVKIIVNVTEKVAYAVSSVDYVKGAIMEALATYRDDVVVTYVSPAQRETIESLEDEIKAKYGVETLKVRFDENLSENGCLIETRFGIVDLSKETKLKNYRKILEQAAKEESAKKSFK